MGLDVVFPLVFQDGPFFDCLVYNLGFDLCVLNCPVGLLEGFVGVEVFIGFLDAGPFVPLSGGVVEFEEVFQRGFGVPEC